jgi:hypothetical protein
LFLDVDDRRCISHSLDPKLLGSFLSSRQGFKFKADLATASGVEGYVKARASSYSIWAESTPMYPVSMDRMNMYSLPEFLSRLRNLISITVAAGGGSMLFFRNGMFVLGYEFIHHRPVLFLL